MSKELAKQYDASLYEDKIYKKWEESGYFNPDNLDLDEKAPSYTIILPPPNITAKLHLGHSAMLAIQDLLIRFKRMNGYRTLWLPGTDHAAIATQNVVEKKLLKEGITRHELGREKFLEEVDKFLKKTQSIILNQTRKMGASLDWSRLAFTLDDQRKKAVKKMFIDMYNEGVIYRGERVVNWCPRCKSTLADDEVEHKAQTAKLYTFKYSNDFPFAISTTRPETKLADTAIAVNPKDKRYKKYIGKTFDINFCGVNLKLEVIASRHVEIDFGTGALGVTPAHSMTDWQMAEENDLKIIKLIDEDGNILKGFGEYSGLSSKKARGLVIEKLKEQGLIEKEENVDNSLSICYRCDAPIEPLPSRQWFVDVDKKLKRLKNKSIKEKAIKAAEKGDIKFYPERFGKTYDHWMKNLHNWCISRQLWFGHRIPVWYRPLSSRAEPSGAEGSLDDNQEIYVGEDKPEGDGWEQDPDTLDTWFSSGMWTFSTLGWPDNYKDGKKIGDLDKFHPTQVLETGYEIITLWVSRMIMMSFFALGEIPFKDVYLHGMVLDDKGKKMSKSKGNGIDPLDVIPKYGTDAVRLSLVIGSTPGNDMKLSEEKIESYRNFTNKLWNVSRYILSCVDEKDYDKEIDVNSLTEADKWILSKLSKLEIGVTEDIKNYNFSQAGEKLKSFTWDDLADWYLEASKFQESTEKEVVLIHTLKTILKLWHPFIPFVTEAIWSEFNDSLLMVEKWPTPFCHSEGAKATEESRSFASAQDDKKGKESLNINVYTEIKIDGKVEIDVEKFDLIKDIITGIRNARAENKIEPAKKVKAIIYAGDDLKMVKESENLIKNMRTGISQLEILKKGEDFKDEICVSVGKIKIYLIGAIDKDKEKQRLEKEVENLEKFTKSIEGKLNNKEFVKNAPKEIVKQEKERLEKTNTELEQLKEQFKNL